MSNTEIFQRVFWSFKPSIERFEHCYPILSIDGTHLYEKYKCTLLIAMWCEGNNQLFPLTFAIIGGENIDSWGWLLACIKNKVTQRTKIFVISDRHPSIMAAMSDPHLGWAAPSTYKLLNNLVCRAVLGSIQRKFNKHLAIIGRINSETQ